ncbi:unnamed protein product [Mytilus edulis]|uniref:Poly [ADP-ribose] polymerase n=1 Tax=Mytilus edulis TaxID=6550 RepID=A0A8S3T7D9_MYTED|nr:unnamed protein product [Mytilus edulis]
MSYFIFHQRAEKPDLQRRNTTPDPGGARPKQPQQDGHVVLYKAVRDCLRQCSIRNHDCVAFSAVGTGQLLKYPVHEVVNCLVSEAKVTAQRSKCITELGNEDICVSLKECYIFTKMGLFEIYRLEKLSESVIYDRHKHGSSPSDSKEAVGPKDGSDKPKLTVQAISVELFAVSKAEGEKIRKTLSTEIKDTFLNEDSIKNDKIKSLSTSTWKKIIAAKKGHVWIERDNDRLTIKGEKDTVSKTKTEILEILLDVKTVSPSGRNDNHQNGQKAGGPHDYWFSKCDDANVPSYWKHFQGNIRQAAENVKGFFTGDKAKKVTIERDENMFKYIEQLVMKTWDNTKVGQGADAKNLNHSRIQVTKIQRIENYGLFDKYLTTKKKFYRHLAQGRKYAALEHVTGGGKKLSSGPILTAQHSKKAGLDLASHANECYLFHGT